MTHHEELRERYEDALFALLMDEVARAEGEQALLLTEELKEPSENLAAERSCMGTIRRAFRREQTRRAGRISLRALGRVAMAAGIAAMLFVGAFATSETVRADTLNLMIEVSETGTIFTFLGNVGKPASTTPFLVPQWLPDGFIASDASTFVTNSWVRYERSPEEFIDFTYLQTDGTVLDIDTENAKVEIIPLNGQDATLVQKGDVIQVVYVTEDQLYYVHVHSAHVSLDDFLHAVENLT